MLSLDGMDEETLTALRGPAASYAKAERNLDALLRITDARSDPPTLVIQMLDLHRNTHQHEAFLARWASSGRTHVHAFIKDLDGDDPDLGRPRSRPLAYLCTYPWRSVVVLWDGTIVPCCRDADAAVVLGSLAQSSLQDVWRGERVAQLRRIHRAPSAPAGHLCTGCAWRRERFAAAMPDRHPDSASVHPLQW